MERVETLHGGVTTRSIDHVSVNKTASDIVEGEFKELLQEILGVNFDEQEHTRNTPKRFIQMLRDLTTPEHFEFTVFDNDKGLDEIVACYNIPFYTLCAHHIVPFYGVAHVGYVPNGSIAGLSKLARTVRHFARGLNVQEELTVDIAEFLDAKLTPKGVAVVMEGEHLCMAMRGVEVPGVRTRTSSMSGVFGDHTRTAKAEFMEGIRSAH